MTIPLMARRSGRTLVTSLPSNRIEPSVGRCRPAIVRSSVDLPAPLAPMMAYTSPGNTRSEIMVQRAQLPVVHGQVPDLQYGLAVSRSLRALVFGPLASGPL